MNSNNNEFDQLIVQYKAKIREHREVEAKYAVLY
jgi:hypothetical protein